jgi:hypothetical protein
MKNQIRTLLTAFMMSVPAWAASSWIGNAHLMVGVDAQNHIWGLSLKKDQVGVHFLNPVGTSYEKSSVFLDRLPYIQSQLLPTDARAVQFGRVVTNSQIIFAGYDSSAQRISQAPSGFWGVRYGKTPVWLAANAGQSDSLNESRFVQNMVQEKDSIWFNAGDLGVGQIVLSQDTLTQSAVRYWSVDTAQKKLTFLDSCGPIPKQIKGQSGALSVYAMAKMGSKILLGTSKGLWLKSADQITDLSLPLLGAKVTGVWSDLGEIYVQAQSGTSNQFWYSADSAKTWLPVSVDALSLAKNPIAMLDLKINSMVKMGDVFWASGVYLSNAQNGVLKFKKDKLVLRPSANSGESKSVTLEDVIWGESEKIIQGQIPVFDIQKGLVDSKEVLVTATHVNEIALIYDPIANGNGIGISRDSGATFEYIFQKTAVSAGLKELRCTPSYLQRNESVSRLNYRLDEDAQVDIEVMSYDMRPVRTIIKNAWRKKAQDGETSALSSQDFWDGKDDNGRVVSAGIYYVRVQTSSKKSAWGKILKLAGGK